MTSIARTSLYNHLMSFVLAASFNKDLTQEDFKLYLEDWENNFIEGQGFYFKSFSDESREVLKDVSERVIVILKKGLLYDVESVMTSCKIRKEI